MKVKDLLIEAPAPLSLKLSDFPLALEEMKKKHSAKRVEKLGAVFIMLEQAMKDGEIVSNQLEEVKYAFGWLIESSLYDYLMGKYWYAGKYADLPPDIRDINVPRTAREIPGYIKKLKSFTTTSSVLEEGVKRAEELLPLTTVTEWIKTHTIKTNTKKTREREVKVAAENEYRKKWTDHKDVKKVIALLKQTAADFEDKIYKEQLKFLQRDVDLYKKDSTDGETSPWILYKENGWLLMTLQKLVERVKNQPNNEQTKYVLVKDWKVRIEEKAKRIALDIIDHFIHKNAGKLSYLIYTKNNLSSVEIENVRLKQGCVVCDVVCEFKDRSEFIANSSVVYARSHLGNLFFRYPTIFRNVKLPDGSQLTKPSEQRMDEVFAITK